MLGGNGVVTLSSHDVTLRRCSVSGGGENVAPAVDP